MIRTKIEQLWNDLKVEEEHSTGIVRKRYSADSVADAYVSVRLPEKIEGIAFRFTKDIFIDLNIFKGNKDIHADLVDDDSSDFHILVLSIIDRDLIEIFSLVSENLFEAIAGSADQRETLKRLNDRFIQWNSLFAKARDTSLTSEAQLGLYGELYFLRRLLQSNQRLCDMVDSWMGPESGIRDFELNDWAVEVKSTRSHNPQRFTVSSERQLDETNVDCLYLFHLSVESRNGEDITLNSMVDDIFNLLSENSTAQIHFANKLLNAGYFKKHKDQYSSTSYVIRRELYYKIECDFPRIEEADLRKGVGDVKYSVILSSIDESFETTFDSIYSKFPQV